MSKSSRVIFGAIFVVSMICLAACATQPHALSTPLPGKLIGFLFGLFHGFIATFSLIASIFTDVRIYAYPNTGFFYDLGFYIGIVGHGPVVIHFTRRRF